MLKKKFFEVLHKQISRNETSLIQNTDIAQTKKCAFFPSHQKKPLQRTFEATFSYK